MDETHEATRAVAALLDLAAVGVEDPIAEIDAWLPSPLNEQNLVAANAEMAVSQQAQLLLPQFDRLAHAVEHDKVVAESVHLDKCQFHSFSGICGRRKQ